MHIRGNINYRDWKRLWEDSYQSPYFQASYDASSRQTDWSLSERQLFTQSNGRTLLGQDTMGQLHFLCTPHEKIYAVPSGGNDIGGQFKGHIGQYYQNDTALFLGKMRYEIELSSGLMLPASDESAKTSYLDDFMPYTHTKRPELETRVFSLAPVLEQESLKSSVIHPLPGPAGACFCMEIHNTAGCTISGRVRLEFDQKFVNQFEHYGNYFEDYTQNPYKSEWDSRLLVLWHPEGCAALQMLDGICEGNPENPRIYVPFELKAGERRVFTTIAAVTPERKDIYEALGVIYQHTALEWVNITAAFWKERLGHIRIGIRENAEWGMKYRDMHIHFLLDNFNCLSFNGKGELLTNWQGAPSHSLSRLWGIDIEPDVLSVMYVIPEIGPSAIRYLVERNVPRYSLYSDHSMFYYVSPLVLAGKYLELTGDEAYFRDDIRVTGKLKEYYEGMLAHKHPEKSLFTSRYASDLIVFRKYDYGANVKCFYALKAYRMILKAVGQNTDEVDELLARMPSDMSQCMEGDGPFGRQITGGTNLGESGEEHFYIPEDIYYYAGEDTTTVMAPLYGLYEFDYEPYRNLHRYARSMFITSYDPEYQTMRELHFGMNPSATGCTLKLGGSNTRAEMLDTMGLLYDRLDETGSLFWWPRAHNKKRCLTRCSQGQGAWIQQSVEQWLGLRIDGSKKKLTIRPQGLLTEYELKDFRIGSYCFDLQYEEKENGTWVSVTSHNQDVFQLIVGIREFGAGAQGKLYFESTEIYPEKQQEIWYQTTAASQPNDLVVKTECLQQKENMLFGPYGLVMPKLYAGECSTFLLRFVLAHMEKQDWHDIEVKLLAPESFRVCAKACYEWDYQPVFSASEAACHMKKLEPETHGTAGFYVNLPDELKGDEKSVMLSRHPFQNPFAGEEELCLYIEGKHPQKLSPLRVILSVSGTVRSQLEIPVYILDTGTYQVKYDKMYHGE